MDYNRSIVVVGGEDDNQAKLSTQLEPIRLSQNKSLAIKSIFHGTVFNINKYNNYVHYQITANGKTFDSAQANEIFDEYFQIPEGNYENAQAVLEEISNKFTEIYPDGSRYPLPRFEVIQTRKKDFSRITVHNLIIRVIDRRETPWNLLNIFDNLTDSKINKIVNVNFSQGVMPSFLYVNIVESSYINGKLSRNLSIIPLKMNKGWSFYEFKDPIYTSIDVKEFSKIIFEIRDINGNFVSFDPKFNTLITLHISTINMKK